MKKMKQEKHRDTFLAYFELAFHISDCLLIINIPVLMSISGAEHRHRSWVEPCLSLNRWHHQLLQAKWEKKIINLLLSTLRKLNYIFSFGSCATATINATWRTARRNRVKQSIINHTATSQRHPNEVWRWRCIRSDSLIMCHSTALYWAMVVLSSFGDGWEGKA